MLGRRARVRARDRDVDPAEHLDGARHGRIDLARDADVGDDVTRFSPGMRDVADRLAEEAFISARDHDSHAARGQREGNRAPHPLPSAGDERGLPVERARFANCHGRELRGKRSA